MTPRKKYFRPDTGRQIVRYVPCTLWSDDQVQRLIDDLAEAPLIPEHFIERYTRSNAYSPHRKSKGFRRAKLLSDMQYEVLLASSQGKQLAVMKHEGISKDPSQQMAIIRGKLGCYTNEQAVAVAVGLGIIPAPEPMFPPGKKFQMTSFYKQRRELTKREQQVLRRIANGMTEQEIGDELGISKDTVHEFGKRLKSKYGVRNNAHLAAVAVRMGHIG